ncbi:25319_t:CDS:2, partial [Racocetra persica]
IATGVNIDSRIFHTAVLGKNTTAVNNENHVIYLFDTMAYKWVTSYSPKMSNILLEDDSTNTSKTTTGDAGPGVLSMPALIGIVVGSVFFGLGLLLLFFLYYQRYRRKISGMDLNPITVTVTTESAPDHTSN